MVAVNLMTHHISRISGLSLQAREREREVREFVCSKDSLLPKKEWMDVG
jgi:hypothetical protein